MLLRREMGRDRISEIVGLTTPWLQSELFESLVELNGQCLELLAEQALTQPVQGSLLLRQVGEIWRSLDSHAKQRAAACPYLLLDVGFADSSRWQWMDSRQVSTTLPAPYSTFFTVPRAVPVARQVFIYAWHLARSKSVATQILLGMPSHCSHSISACTLPQVHEIAERHHGWLRPRWPSKVKMWRDLLLAAASGEALALENARMYGLQLLAAECRAASIKAIIFEPRPEMRTAVRTRRLTA